MRVQCIRSERIQRVHVQHLYMHHAPLAITSISKNLAHEIGSNILNTYGKYVRIQQAVLIIRDYVLNERNADSRPALIKRQIRPYELYCAVHRTVYVYRVCMKWNIIWWWWCAFGPIANSMFCGQTFMLILGTVDANLLATTGTIAVARYIFCVYSRQAWPWLYVCSTVCVLMMAANVIRHTYNFILLFLSMDFFFTHKFDQIVVDFVFICKETSLKFRC